MNRFDALGDRELRAVLRLVRSRPDAATTDDVAAELGVARSVARWRLERLVDHGLLVARFARRSGRAGPGAGRPAKTYAAAPETAALEFPRRRYEELLRLLVDAVPARGRSGRLAEVGIEFGRELARAGDLRPGTRLATAFDRICRALGALGFQVAVESLEPDGAVLVTPTCPMRPLVVNANAARDLDRGMWRGLVGAALPSADVRDVRCETRDCLAGESSCRVEIRLA